MEVYVPNRHNYVLLLNLTSGLIGKFKTFGTHYISNKNVLVIVNNIKTIFLPLGNSVVVRLKLG